MNREEVEQHLEHLGSVRRAKGALLTGMLDKAHLRAYARQISIRAAAEGEQQLAREALELLRSLGGLTRSERLLLGRLLLQSPDRAAADWIALAELHLAHSSPTDGVVLSTDELRLLETAITELRMLPPDSAARRLARQMLFNKGP